MEKHTFASVSLIVRDRAISLKFSTHRVSQQSTLANFVQVLEQNSCFPLGGHYACQCVLFLVKSQIQKGAIPEKAARHGYEKNLSLSRYPE